MNEFGSQYFTGPDPPHFLDFFFYFHQSQGHLTYLRLHCFYDTIKSVSQLSSLDDS